MVPVKRLLSEKDSLLQSLSESPMGSLLEKKFQPWKALRWEEALRTVIVRSSCRRSPYL
jgi:hypothetical protein